MKALVGSDVMMDYIPKRGPMLEELSQILWFGVLSKCII